MRVVIDTNIFLSGIFWGGKPQKVLFLWRDGKIDLVITPQIFKEIKKKLLLAAKKFYFDVSVVKDWLAIIDDYTFKVKPSKHFDLCRDPDDNKFLDAAFAGKAEFIITGDKDLLTIKKFDSIKIITPSEFLKINRL